MDATDLQAIRDELAELRSENRDLRARLDAIEHEPPTPTAPAPAAPTATVAPAPRAMDRRRLLRDGLAAGAAGVAATAAVVGSGQPAAAADGQALVLGQANTSTAQTTLTTTSGTGHALRIDAEVPGGSSGLDVTSNSVGARIEGMQIGLGVRGGFATMQLGADPSRQPPHTDPVAHFRGDIVADGQGDVWYCTAPGSGSNPGTFRKVVGPASSGAFHVLPSPVRLYDSRPGTIPSFGDKAPFSPDETRTFDLTGGAIPHRATAVVFTLLLVNASATAGNLTVWAGYASKPLSNSVVWGGTAGRFTATAITALGYGSGPTGRIQVHASQRTHLVMDIVGYYR